MFILSFAGLAYLATFSSRSFRVLSLSARIFSLPKKRFHLMLDFQLDFNMMTCLI